MPPGTWADTVLIAYDATLPVGTLRRTDGMGNERAQHVVFEQHPSDVLKALMGPGSAPADASSALLLKLNRLVVDEIGDGSLCLLHAEVIRRDSSNFARLFESSVQVRGKRCGSREECHEENIKDALQVFLNRYRKQGDRDPVPLAASDLELPFSIDTSNTPVLGAAGPKRGLYYNFMQFRRNEPDTLQDFATKETTYSPGDERIVRLKGIPANEADALWGFSNGSDAYVRVGRVFIKLSREGNTHSVYVPQAAAADAPAVMLGALYFGLVGGLVAVAISSSGTGPSLLCDVDPLCGDLRPHDMRRQTADYAEHIFFVTRFAKGDGTVMLTTEGIDPVVLGRRQWTRFKLPPEAALRTITIAGPAGSEAVVIDTNTDKVNAYLIDVKKDGSIKVNRLNEQMRNSAMEDLKQEDKRPTEQVE